MIIVRPYIASVFSVNNSMVKRFSNSRESIFPGGLAG